MLVGDAQAKAKATRGKNEEKKERSHFGVEAELLGKGEEGYEVKDPRTAPVVVAFPS